MGVEARHEAFTRLLADLQLDPQHQADLRRRGFTDDQIQQAGFRSITKGHRLANAPAHLPGFRGETYQGQSGFLLPIQTIDGQVVGFQTRSANGYRWASIDGNYRLPIDEPPLVFLPGTTDTIYLVEGTGAKPAFINQTTGAMTVGASGGRWNGSPQQIEQLVRRYPDATFTLLPDAGSTLNPRITDNYQQTADLLSSLNVELGFQWWDQLEKDIDADADETPFWINGSRLLSSEFFGQDFRQGCNEAIQVRRDHKATRPATTTSDGTFLPADAIPAEAPVVMVEAGMGSGKTKVLVDTIHADDTRTLLGSHRRNLSKNTSARTGTIPYRQDGEIFDATTGEVITSGVPTSGDSACVDSWHPTSSLKRTAEDIAGSRVAFDEIDQVFDHLLRGATCRQFRASIIDTLRQGLPQSQQFIGASGTLDDITLELVEGITGQDVHLHRHNSTADRWSHSFLENDSHALGQIQNAVARGENVLISTAFAGDDNHFSPIGAQNLLDYLRQRCSGLDETNSDAFTSKSIADAEPDSRQKRFMRDPVSAVRELRVAIYSPVAETGVDINLQGHFDSVFVLAGDGTTMTPQAVVQAASRLRDPNAHRFFCVPKASRLQRGHGITDWKELLAITVQDAEFNRARSAILTANVLRNDIRPTECPFLRAWAKLEVRAELDAKHFRFVVQSLLKDFGSQRKTASVVTESDKASARQVRQFVDQKRSTAAVAVITAPLPGTPEHEVASREQKTAGRRRQRIELTTGKRLTTDNTSEAEVLQSEKAFKGLKLRHLLNHPHLAITIDEQARKGISDWAPDEASINCANRVEAMLEMGARDLLQPGKVWSSADREVQQLNDYLGANSARLRMLFGKKAKRYADPVRALSWLAGLVGLKTNAMEKTRINGRQVTPQRVVEVHDAVNVDEILAHWTKNPAIVSGIQPNQEPLQSLEPVPNCVTGLENNDELGTLGPTGGDRQISLPSAA